MKRSKFFSLVLVIAMLLAAMLPVTAYMAPDDPGIITIEAPARLTLNDQTFKVYKIFDVQYNDGKTAYVYTISDDFKDFTGYPSFATETLLQYLEDQSNNSEAMDDLAAALWGYIESNSIVPEKSVTVPKTSIITTLEIDELPLGYYLVYGTGFVDFDYEPDPAHPSNPVLDQQVVALCALTTTDPTAAITLKADAPDIDKLVWDHNTGSWSDWTDVNIGDVVDFKLESEVPNTRGYSKYEYIIHDVMSAGLTFDPESVDVKIAGSGLSRGPDNTPPTGMFGYSVYYNSHEDPLDDGCTFEVVFNPTLLLRSGVYQTGSAIVITYSATLNEEAIIGNPGNPNDVYLEYSSNPYDTNERHRTPWHRVIVFTFDMGILKIDGDTEEPLEDAVFQLRTKTGDATSAIQFTLEEEGDDTEPNVYIVDPDGETDITTPESGLIYIKGLDAGTYYLYEKEAPIGYHLLTDEIEVVITHTVTNGVSDYVTLSVTVENFGGPKLPITGSIGTILFYLASGVITAGLITFFIIRRRWNILNGKSSH